MSEPLAEPPLLALTFTNPPFVVQVAVAPALLMAVAVARQFSIEGAVAPLFLLAVALALPVLTEHSASAPES